MNGALLSLSTPTPLGRVPVGGAASFFINISNSGDMSATLTGPTNIDTVTDISDLTTARTDFIYVGGSFPGTLGTCSTTLAVGDNCTVQLSAVPQTEGHQGLNYGFSYDAGGWNRTVSTPITYFALPVMIATPNPKSNWTFDLGEVPEATGAAYMPLIIFNPNDHNTDISVTRDTSAPTNCGPDFTYTGGVYPGNGILSSPIPLCSTTLAANSKCRIELKFTPSTSPQSLSCQFRVDATSAENTTYVASQAPMATITAGAITTVGTSCACNPVDSVNFGGGNGAASTPWQICSNAHLARMHSQFTANAGWNGAYFIQCSDINVAGNLTPIGCDSASVFNGHYNGLGNRIQNATLSGSGTCDVGVFSRVGALGTVSNLGVSDVSYTGNITTTGLGVGAIAGFNAGNISTVWSTGAISTGTTTAAPLSVAGLVGNPNNGVTSSPLSNSWSMATITSPAATHSNTLVSGLAGYGDVEDSFFAGRITDAIGVYNAGIVSQGINVRNVFSVGEINGVGDSSGISSTITPSASFIPENLANYGDINAYSSSTGIAGELYATNGAVTYSHLFNYGNLTSEVGVAIGLVNQLWNSVSVDQALSIGNLTGFSALGASNNIGNGTVSRHEVLANLTSTNNVINRVIAGIAAILQGTLTNSYFFGEMNAGIGSDRLSGLVDTSFGTMTNNYSFITKTTGAIQSTHLCVRSPQLGHSVTNQYGIYSSGGDLISGTIQSLSGMGVLNTTTGCTSTLGATTAINQGSYSGWDFTNIWSLPGTWTQTPGIQH